MYLQLLFRAKLIGKRTILRNQRDIETPRRVTSPEAFFSCFHERDCYDMHKPIPAPLSKNEYFGESIKDCPVFFRTVFLMWNHLTGIMPYLCHDDFDETHTSPRMPAARLLPVSSAYCLPYSAEVIAEFSFSS